MSPNANPPVLKIKTMMPAADANCTAVALTERSAGFVSFQRHQPSLPPDTNVSSAVSLVLAAVNSAPPLPGSTTIARTHRLFWATAASRLA